MAERALLARRRPDGRYDVDRARWGGTNEVLAAVFGGEDPSTLAGVEWTHWRCGIQFDNLVGRIDYLSTAVCYRVHDETTPFLALWFGLPLREESAAPTTGALVAVHSLTDARGLRAEFRELKGALVDELAAGTVPAAAAPFVVAAWVRAQTGRETYLPTLFQLVGEH